MKKTYGVCFGLLALGLAGLGAPASRAAANEAGGGSETAVTSAATPSTPAAVSAPADLQKRIDALKAELAELNSELAAAASDPGTATPVAPDTATQDQGSPTPANPQQAPTPAANAAAPMPLPNPSMTAPLSTAVPHEIAAGPFGKLQVTGILSGLAWAQDNHVPGDKSTQADVSNAQVFVQKTTGWFQFYFQGGVYNIPALGTPFTATSITNPLLYGPLPQGYVKLVKGNFNVEVGALPTLIGAEYTFDFENMNIERGLLWNQENAVNRGIQVNDTYKKLSLSFSWNDGFYSNHYSWLSGSAAWAFNSANTLTFVAGGNFRSDGRNTTATPLFLNNSEIYNIIYTYTKGNLMITPYYQYTRVHQEPNIGILEGAHTNGGALLVNYNFKHGFSLAARPEYIKSSGNTADPDAINLLYGPATGAFSFTVTPTWAKDGFFIRGDFSAVHATNFNSTTDLAFGPTGSNANQLRGAVEAGFMF